MAVNETLRDTFFREAGMNRRILLHVVVVAIVSFINPSRGGDPHEPNPSPQERAADKPALLGDDAPILPFVDESTYLIVRLDPTAVNAPQLERWLVTAIELAHLGTQKTEDAKTELRNELKEAKSAWGKWNDAGGGRMYLILDSEEPGSPIVIAPLNGKSDPKRLTAFIAEDNFGDSTDHIEKIGDALVAAPPAKLERLKEKHSSKTHPDLADALKATGQGPFAIVLISSPVTRVALEKMMPTLPAELGGGSVKVLSDGVVWAALGQEAALEPELHLIVEAKDAESAINVIAIEQAASDWAASHAHEAWFDVQAALKLIVPKREGKRVTISLDNSKLQQLFISIALPILLPDKAADPTTSPATKPAAITQ